LQHAAEYEQALAELLVASAPHDEEAIAWSEHPHRVSEPQWRRNLAAGLVAAEQATGRPQAASLESLLALLENGWGDTLAATLAPAPAAPDDGEARPPTDLVLGNLLEAAVSLAFLDGKAATMTWNWPNGTVLRGPGGDAVAVSSEVSAALADLDAGGDCRRLRTWLSECGVDANTALWLAGGVEPAPERALFAFVGFRHLRTFHVVLSDRCLRFFPRGPIRALSEQTRMQMTGPGSVLAARMLAVDAGEVTDQVADIDLASVVQATFTPMVGGHGWRLRLRTANQRTSIRGNGDGRDVQAATAEVLGDRLSTRWLHAHPWLRRVRNMLGYTCTGLAGLGLIAAAIVLVQPPADIDRQDSIVVAAFSLLVLAIGLLPDLIAAAVRRSRREHPDPIRILGLP
jgi:hypothetical protein